MKKLFPVMAITLFISGCMTSVTPANANTSNQALQTQQDPPYPKNTKLNSIGFIGFISIANMETCPKKAGERWTKLAQTYYKIKRNMNEYEQSYLTMHVRDNIFSLYTAENSTSLKSYAHFTKTKVVDMFNSDPKFRKAVLNLAIADIEAAGFGCYSSVELMEQKLESLISGDSQGMQSFR